MEWNGGWNVVKNTTSSIFILLKKKKKSEVLCICDKHRRDDGFVKDSLLSFIFLYFILFYSIFCLFFLSLSVSVCDAAGTYSLAEDGCVQVHSPNYPYPYDVSTSCSLQVVAPSYCKVVVQYCQVALEKCPYDSLTVTDGVTR